MLTAPAPSTEEEAAAIEAMEAAISQVIVLIITLVTPGLGGRIQLASK